MCVRTHYMLRCYLLRMLYLFEKKWKKLHKFGRKATHDNHIEDLSYREQQTKKFIKLSWTTTTTAAAATTKQIPNEVMKWTRDEETPKRKENKTTKQKGPNERSARTGFSFLWPFFTWSFLLFASFYRAFLLLQRRLCRNSSKYVWYYFSFALLCFAFRV